MDKVLPPSPDLTLHNLFSEKLLLFLNADSAILLVTIFYNFSRSLYWLHNTSKIARH